LATKTTTSEATMNMDRTTTDQRLTGIARVLPLAGIGFAGLTIAGDLVIGPFPDGASPTSVLSASYRAHHSQVALGGMLYGWAAVFFALFAAAVYMRLRPATPLFAGLLLLGAAVDTGAQALSSSVYSAPGDIGAQRNLSPAGLQAWQIWGSEFGIGVGIAIFMIALAAASVTTRCVPLWLGLSGLVLGLAQLTPVGFLASLITLPWAIAAGVSLARRPADTQVTIPVGASPQPV
jgi:hypothetical protein